MSLNLAYILRESAKANPAKPALLFDGGQIGYGQLDAMSDQFARGLQGAGYKPGDRIGLQLPNIPQFVIAYFGILKAGCVAVPMNVLFKAGWSHEFADLTRPVTASFVGAPALTFTTQGAIAPRDGVVLGLGANTQVAERTSLYLRYGGDLAGANTNHVLNAGVRYVW